MRRLNEIAHSFPIAVAVLATMVAVPRAQAQAAGGVTQAPSGQPRSLLITVVEGEGALNDIRTRTAREPIVQVDDENHKPVAGVLVLFSLDKTGTTYASFGGAPTVSVQTDQAGRAVAKAFQIAHRKGNYQISVHATYGDLAANAVINESNVTAAASGNATTATVGVVAHKKVIWIVSGVLAGGAVAGIVIATQQSSSPTTVAAGTGTVGAPAAVGGVRFQLHALHR